MTEQQQELDRIADDLHSLGRRIAEDHGDNPPAGLVDIWTDLNVITDRLRAVAVG